MRVIAIESSGRTASLALLDAATETARLVVERQTPADERTAQSLAPTAAAALAEAGWRPRDVELVCVTTGPGSFTGLRIGVVMAKTLAYAVGAHLVGVHTLAALAAAVEAPYRRLWTILDAQRQELFTSSFTAGEPVALPEPPATSIRATSQFIERLQPGDAVAGPPLAALRRQLPAAVAAVDESLWRPRASAVGSLGIALYKLGCAVDPIDLVPRYYRRSAAEEKFERARGETA